MPDRKQEMSSDRSRELLLLLKDMEQRSRQHAGGLPDQEEAHWLWEGIQFLISGTTLVASLKDVREILNFPAVLTPIPGTQPWMLGIANIRGTLLPVIDLQRFTGGKAIATDKHSRVLVFDHNGVRAGLLVGEVRGMHHFSEDQHAKPPQLAGPLNSYISEAFHADGRDWPVFDIGMLMESPDFQKASL
jgi:twitching motility protein PilI